MMPFRSKSDRTYPRKTDITETHYLFNEKHICKHTVNLPFSEYCVDMTDEAYDFYEQLDGHTDPEKCKSTLTLEERDELLKQFQEYNLLEKEGWNLAGNSRYRRLMTVHLSNRLKDACFDIYTIFQTLTPMIFLIGYGFRSVYSLHSILEGVLGGIIAIGLIVIGTPITQILHAGANDANPKAVFLVTGEYFDVTVATDNYHDFREIVDKEFTYADWMMFWSGILILIPGGIPYAASHCCIGVWAAATASKQFAMIMLFPEQGTAIKVFRIMKLILAILLAGLVIWFY